jgi:hypothetical protein
MSILLFLCLIVIGLQWTARYKSVFISFTFFFIFGLALMIHLRSCARCIEEEEHSTVHSSMASSVDVGHGVLRTAAVYRKSVEIVVQLRGRRRQRRQAGPLDGADDTLDGEAVVPQVRRRLEPLVLHEAADTSVVAARRMSERGDLGGLGGLRRRRGASRVDEAEAVEHRGVSGAAAADEPDEDRDVAPRVLVVAVRVEHDGPAVAGRVERLRLDGPADADAPGVGVASHREQVRAHRDLAGRRRHGRMSGALEAWKWSAAPIISCPARFMAETQAFAGGVEFGLVYDSAFILISSTLCSR